MQTLIQHWGLSTGLKKTVVVSHFLSPVSPLCQYFQDLSGFFLGHSAFDGLLIMFFIELDDGTIYRKTLYLMVKTHGFPVDFPLNQSIEFSDAE